VRSMSTITLCGLIPLLFLSMGAKEIYVNIEPSALEVAKKMAKAASEEQDAEIKKRLLGQLAEQVRHKLSPEELDAASKSKQSNLLQDMATFEKAENAYETGQIDKAKTLLSTYVGEYPVGYFTDLARMMLDKIDKMLKLDPTMLGVSLPLSGRFKDYGERALAAMRIAISELGDKAPKLVVVDSQGDQDAARNAALRLLKKDGVLAIVGDIGYESTLGLKDVADRFGVPVITLSARDELAGKDSPIIRFLAGPEHDAELLVSEAGLKRYALLTSKDPASERKRDAIAKAIVKNGGMVLKQVDFEPQQTTFTDQAKELAGRGDVTKNKAYKACVAQSTKAKKKNTRQVLEACKAKVPVQINYEGLIIVADAPAIHLILPALAAEDVRFSQEVTNSSIKSVSLFGLKEMADPSLQKNDAKLLEGAVLVGPPGRGNGGGQAAQFKERFIKAKGSAPGIQEMAAHDAVLTLGILMSDEVFKDRREFKKRLADFAPVDGVLGTIGPVQDGVFDISAPILTYNDGQLVPLYGQPSEEPGLEQEPEGDDGTDNGESNPGETDSLPEK